MQVKAGVISALRVGFIESPTPHVLYLHGALTQVSSAASPKFVNSPVSLSSSCTLPLQQSCNKEPVVLRGEAHRTATPGMHRTPVTEVGIQ